MPNIDIVAEGECLAQNRTLFFVTCSKTCPLPFAQRLAWSYLLKCHKKKGVGTQSELADLTGFHRDRCRRAFQRLIDLGLVERPHYRAVIPKRPKDGTADWFHHRKTSSNEWVDGLAYFPVTLSKERPAVDDVALWLLKSFARNATSAKWQSYAGLAERLGCDWTTIRRALQELQKDGRIEVLPIRENRFRKIDRFDVLISRDQVETPQTEIGNRNAASRQPVFLGTERIPSEREVCLNQMTKGHKIPYTLASEIVHIVFEKLRPDYPMNVLLANLGTAAENHDGKQTHPGYLLRHKIDQLLNKKKRKQRWEFQVAC